MSDHRPASSEGVAKSVWVGWEPGSNALRSALSRAFFPLLRPQSRGGIHPALAQQGLVQTSQTPSQILSTLAPHSLAALSARGSTCAGVDGSGARWVGHGTSVARRADGASTAGRYDSSGTYFTE